MARPRFSFLPPRPLPQALRRGPLPDAGAPDPALLALVGPEACLRFQILPWERVGGGVVVYAESAAQIDRAAQVLAPLGRIFIRPATPDAIRAALLRHVAGPLRDLAESKTPEALSVRGMKTRPLLRPLVFLATVLLALTLLVPLAVPALLLLLMSGVILCTASLRAAALLASRLPPPPADTGAEVAQWPVISVMVPLLREGPMVGRLIDRLSALDYPTAHYDLCLVVEEDDHQTRDALSGLDLPAHAQVVTVPKGRIQTKPRALNYALPFTRGTIIGIYDAEDRPAPDQLRQVARHFARARPEVVCLQGQLDYYNARHNWLSRCFTLEYCAWFRVILPGIARLGLPVPLGGTTLFIRRHAIEALGGWDAHNVTEDADLGIRIARFGYATEIIPTVTEEEANARPWAWVKQRSRWFKGYALTWAVHMRDPRALWRDLGWRRFLGVQLTLLGALLTFLGAPVFWAFGLASLAGLGHVPLLTTALSALYVLAFSIDLTVQVTGVRRAGKAHLILWAPTTAAYFPMATVAAWRALVQALRDPFTWEKTEHGMFHPTPKAVAAEQVTEDPPKPAPAARQVSGG